MVDMQIAVISDVHGNRWALKAVLANIDRRGIRRVLNLGDSVYGPLAPAATADMLLELNLPTVRGNEDRLIVEPVDDSQQSPTLRYVRDNLKERHLQWLKAMEMTSMAYDDFFLCHGSPHRDDEYLLQQVTQEGVNSKTPVALLAELSLVKQPVVLCGHDHVPRTVSLPDGRVVVNPGSVGLPAYDDDIPFPHVMENGTPHARYAIVSRDENAWRVENVALVYDWESAAAAAMENGHANWARWLLSGKAEPA